MVDELEVRIAHRAGWMERDGQIEFTTTEQIVEAVQHILGEYDKECDVFMHSNSWSGNPDLDFITDKYLISHYGKNLDCNGNCFCCDISCFMAFEGVIEMKDKFGVKYEDNIENCDPSIEYYDTEETANAAIATDLKNAKKYFRGRKFDYGDFGDKVEIWACGDDEYAIWTRLWV